MVYPLFNYHLFIYVLEKFVWEGTIFCMFLKTQV